MAEINRDGTCGGCGNDLAADGGTAAEEVQVLRYRGKFVRGGQEVGGIVIPDLFRHSRGVANYETWIDTTSVRYVCGKCGSELPALRESMGWGPK